MRCHNMKEKKIRSVEIETFKLPRKMNEIKKDIHGCNDNLNYNKIMKSCTKVVWTDREKSN